MLLMITPAIKKVLSGTRSDNLLVQFTGIVKFLNPQQNDRGLEVLPRSLPMMLDFAYAVLLSDGKSRRHPHLTSEPPNHERS